MGLYFLNTFDLAEDQLREDKFFCLLQKDLLEGECYGRIFVSYKKISAKGSVVIVSFLNTFL